MSEQPAGDGWPTVDRLDETGEADRRKLILEALIDEEKDRRKADDDRATAELALTQKMQDSLAAVAVAGIDRARAGAQFVQTAAGAIGGFYTGILALIYVSDAQLPARGVIPTLFLGSSVALAAYYMAFVGAVGSWSRPAWTSDPNEDAWLRLNFITLATRRLAYARAGALRAAVVCLMFGLVTLPIAIVSLPSLNLGGTPLVSITREEASPPPPATNVQWPEPTILAEPGLSVTLYEAQLAEFRDQLGTKAPPPDESGQDRFALAIAVIGFLSASVVWRLGDFLGRRREKAQSPGEVVRPAAPI